MRKPTKTPNATSTAKAAVVRCAVYTRKSSEEGLEQSFNSLDAQREACEAYVASQKSEGWIVLPQMYDDGGISGGTMDRPTLQRLLADVAAGLVDTVVVYKVDRLTRSLGDFAKIVEVFDAASVSFVSVTQSFNTTTSMGRLTLNMLLSFAQFEREVTGERIRDKIAASKAKGMWMGGRPPLGYEVRERKLEIVEAEAETVRHIFTRYAELGSVLDLRDELAAVGITAKRHVSAAGNATGGGTLGRGALYHLLQNRLYRGEIDHKGTIHPGEHEAIVDQDLWDRVQAVLAENLVERAVRSDAASPSLLAGLVRDQDGIPLTPMHANKTGRRYRYYVSHDLIAGRKLSAEDREGERRRRRTSARRIPANGPGAHRRRPPHRIPQRRRSDRCDRRATSTGHRRAATARRSRRRTCRDLVGPRSGREGHHRSSAGGGDRGDCADRRHHHRCRCGIRPGALPSRPHRHARSHIRPPSARRSGGRVHHALGPGDAEAGGDGNAASGRSASKSRRPQIRPQPAAAPRPRPPLPRPAPARRRQVDR
ncbi:MAG: recombinase family protein [Phyllobacteriaceae bacterium]|nr:recombinase family protein [Phyllobacteriaceae bacterium]